MIAAILVGGKGTRLQSVVSDVPKPLAPVGGKPFLALLIQKLASYHVSKIVLLTGYMHDKMVAALGDGSQFGVNITYSQETSPLGTAGALLHAASYLKNHAEFLLINGDTYYSGNLNLIIDTPLEDKIAIMGVMPVNQADRYGSIKLRAGTDLVDSFVEKEQRMSGLVSAGICKLSPRIFDSINANQLCSLENDVFPRILQKGEKIRAVELNGSFYDIGTPESYADFNKLSVVEA